MAIYPLTVPLLVGPDAVAALIVFGNSTLHEHMIPEVAVGLMVFLALLTATILGLGAQP